MKTTNRKLKMGSGLRNTKTESGNITRKSIIKRKTGTIKHKKLKKENG